MSHTVSSKMQPGVMVTLSDDEYALWLELGIVYAGAPIPATTSYLDTQVAELIDRTASATRAEIRALMGADTGGLNDGVVSTLVTGPSTTATTLRGAFAPALLLPGTLSHWQRAKARVRAGMQDTKILCVGDSTTAGIGVVDGTTQGVANSYPGQLAALLNSSGLPASRGLGIPAPTGLTDPRWTLGTGWTAQTTLAWAGTADYGFAGSTFGNLVYADVMADRFDVYYLTGPGLGSFTATATGGSGVVQSTASGSPGVGILSVSAPANTSTLTITPSGPVHIFGVEPWRSTVKQVRVGNAGVGSSTAAAWASDGAGSIWNSQACIKAYAPDLTIISLGLNDAGAGDSASVFLGHLAPLITAAQVSGDVLILPPLPPASSMGGTYLSTISAYVAGLRPMGLPLADIQGRWTSGDAVTALGYYWDARHPNGVGYADLAQLLGRGLLAA